MTHEVSPSDLTWWYAVIATVVEEEERTLDSRSEEQLRQVMSEIEQVMHDDRT